MAPLVADAVAASRATQVDHALPDARFFNGSTRKTTHDEPRTLMRAASTHSRTQRRPCRRSWRCATALSPPFMNATTTSNVRVDVPDEWTAVPSKEIQGVVVIEDEDMELHRAKTSILVIFEGAPHAVDFTGIQQLLDTYKITSCHRDLREIADWCRQQPTTLEHNPALTSGSLLALSPSEVPGYALRDLRSIWPNDRLLNGWLTDGAIGAFCEALGACLRARTRERKSACRAHPTPPLSAHARRRCCGAGPGAVRDGRWHPPSFAGREKVPRNLHGG
eukprot:Unigene358_Nuclearia_a/m.1238 Unigene358_Nuclearia_a/g.1238  ORF Unigene358_Nuclearia_a/g.1238 Unigene358_Nuclearia_a/m.1238 type:complete len:278 (-) Unigene358_Nuclearia_a:343-1176(-)